MKAAIKSSKAIKIEKPNLPHDENEGRIEKTIEKVIEKEQSKRAVKPLSVKRKGMR